MEKQSKHVSDVHILRNISRSDKTKQAFVAKISEYLKQIY